MFQIKKNDITLVRGDTLKATIAITDKNGGIYKPGSTDTIKFIVKENATDTTSVIEIDIPYNTLELLIPSSVTKTMACTDYIYDIALIMDDGSTDGYVDTVINDKLFRLI